MEIELEAPDTETVEADSGLTASDGAQAAMPDAMSEEPGSVAAEPDSAAPQPGGVMLADQTSVETDSEPSETAQATEDAGAEDDAVPPDFIARIAGEPLTELPQDLYIPPEALEVFLEAFEGPLDLLLYLIKRQNLDILDINLADLTRQYMEYVEVMKVVRLELAAEYLVMAATLAEIKSRCLLPRTETADEDEEDPRAELIRRLQEYERYKKAAEDIDSLPRLERDLHVADFKAPSLSSERPHPGVEMEEILLAFAEVMRRAKLYDHHHVMREKLSTRERMSEILQRVNAEDFIPFVGLFRVEEGRIGLVVTFLAIMELVKEALLDLVQNEEFGPIHVKARAA